MAADNMTLGRFRLEGIPPAPRGTPQIEVTFDIDANGILNVSARDQASGREQRVTITASTNLSKVDIERMVEEARRNQSDDQKRRDVVDARNEADNAIYHAEKALSDAGTSVPAPVRSGLEEKIASLRQAMQGSDAAMMHRQAEELGNALAGWMQQAARGAAQPGNGGSAGNASGRDENEGEVIEGEYQET